MINKSYTSTTVVTQELTAVAVGSGDMPVYSTPMMIALMEQAAATLLRGEIEPQNSSVGIALNVEHIKATAVGGTISATATVVSVDGRAVDFELVATDQNGDIIGKGTHRRFIVNRDKFMSKL